MSSFTLSHSDNFSFIDDNSVDLILTDPPFNISKKTNFHTYEKNTIHSYQFDKESEDQWDTYNHDDFLDIMDGWCQEWSRVLKKDGNFVIFCADSYISYLWSILQKNGLSPKRIFTWRKNNAVPVNRKYTPMSACEYIITGVKKGGATFNSDIKLKEQSEDDKILESTLIADKVSTIVFKKIQENIFGESFSPSILDESHIETVQRIIKETLTRANKEIEERVEAYYKYDENGISYLQGCIPNYIQNALKTGKRIHPTEKPVQLLKYFISLFSNEGDTILDSFAGSGSTGEASLQLNRKAILVEKNLFFFDKIKDRLQEHNFVM